MDKKICFVGAGAMAEAIVQGLIHKRVVKPGQISVTNKNDRFRLDELSYNFGIVSEQKQKYALISQADIIVLAMKPKDVVAAIQEIRAYTHQAQLILSVVAGVTTEQISNMLGHAAPVIRTMPNTSAIVGYSSTGMCAGSTATDEHIKLAREIFESIGIVVLTEEKHLDAITGISGSGPAYIYYLVEAMLSAGEQLGLAAQDTRALVLQTVIGAANMLVETNEAPAKLREQVTSPNGTTQAGIETLENYRFQQAIQACITNATLRSKELGEEIKKHIDQANT